MKKRDLVYCCVAAFVASLIVCASSPAQRASENAEEFVEKAVEQAEDGSVRSPQNSNAEIEWDESPASGLPQSQEPQQGQQY